MPENDLLSRLTEIVEPLTKGGIALAFSGGCDSTLLLVLLAKIKRAHDYPLLPFFFRGPFQTAAEFAQAQSQTHLLKLELRIITPPVFEVAEIRTNDRRRCYFCKRLMFSQLKQAAADFNLQSVMEGTNADDLKEYRPGQAALKELGIHSPLADARFSKADVRKLTAELGAPNAGQPSSACLATRFPYDTELTENALRKVEQTETFLKGLGLSSFRVRCHGDLARIELSGEDAAHAVFRKREMIADYFHKCGFRYTTIDLKMFQSGSFDKVENLP